MSAVYKSPKDKLQHQDLNALTNQNGPFIIASDPNAEHTVWNRRRTNTARNTLLRHIESTDLNTVTAPDSPTYYPFNAAHQPDVLDILLYLTYNHRNTHSTISVTSHRIVIQLFYRSAIGQ